MTEINSKSSNASKTFIKESNTGQAQSPAIDAPLSSKDSPLLGKTQTSDAAAAEAKIEQSRKSIEDERARNISPTGETKLEKLAKKPVLES